MLKNNYKVVSKNSIGFLSLHDCECKRVHYENSMLILEMDWMEVLSTHPDNPYNNAHQSDQGQIVLINPVCKKLNFPCADNKESPASLAFTSIDQIDFEDFTVLQFNEVPIENGFYSLILFTNSSNPFVEISLEYSESLVMWNKLGEKSWFEDDKWKI